MAYIMCRRAARPARNLSSHKCTTLGNSTQKAPSSGNTNRSTTHETPTYSARIFITVFTEACN